MTAATIPSVFDTSGVAVITGGASGFGLDVAKRLAKNGMAVAILDVSKTELENAEQTLIEAAAGNRHKVLAVLCNVTEFEECKAAQRAVDTAFPETHISFLFNNAGIAGQDGGKIIEGDNMSAWSDCYAVNVKGAVHIIKAFIPSMVERGPLPSGRKSVVVTTSSVVGLLNHNIGPYSVSKFAVTAMCEQFSHELEDMGTKAAHISPHTLHPTVGATNFLTGRKADGQQKFSGLPLADFAKAGMTTAEDVIDGLFKGLEEGKSYIVVDHQMDVPTHKQVEQRMQDQMSGNRPRKPEQLGMMLMMSDKEAFARRRYKLIANSKL